MTGADQVRPPRQETSESVATYLPAGEQEGEWGAGWTGRMIIRMRIEPSDNDGFVRTPSGITSPPCMGWVVPLGEMAWKP